MEKHFRDYYIVVWLFLVVLWMLYPFMRLSFTDLLRKEGHSKTKIKEVLKGKRNYWFYESVAEQTDHRQMYFCNKVFLLTSIVTILLHAVIGWWEKASIVVAIGICVTCAAFAGIVAFSLVPLKMNYSSKNKKDKGRSPARYIEFVIFPILMILAVIILMCRIWC